MSVTRGWFTAGTENSAAGDLMMIVRYPKISTGGASSRAADSVVSPRDPDGKERRRKRKQRKGG